MAKSFNVLNKHQIIFYHYYGYLVKPILYLTHGLSMFILQSLWAWYRVACTIKLVMYGFRNKLVCLFVTGNTDDPSLLQNMSICCNESVMFYSTGPWYGKIFDHIFSDKVIRKFYKIVQRTLFESTTRDQCYNTFYCRNLRFLCNKLQRLFWQSFSCLRVRTRPTRVKHLSGAPHWGRHLASPTNIRLGWKGLPGTNAVAYYEHS